MSADALRWYKEVWFVDFEFTQPPGERPHPNCMVAREYRSGRLIRLFQDELQSLRGKQAPLNTGADALFVAYYASAELNCFLALDWKLPEYILDLFTEFRCLTNGLPVPHGNGLLGALAYHGLDAMDGLEKKTMRQLSMRGGPFTAEERAALLDYCQEDVDAMYRLLPAMLPKLDLPHALLRGRSMCAYAKMETAGVPIDMDLYGRLKSGWEDIKAELIAEVDKDYGVYDGGTFKRERFERYLERAGIPWPHLPSGEPELADDAFKLMVKSFPCLNPLRELRVALSDMRLNDLSIGSDGRNRCILSAFSARTSRGAPSNTEFIFGPSVWLRGLIRPAKDRAIAYVDWCQQEFGIAAAFSGDVAMKAAYTSGDPYLTFAKQAKAVPPDATKVSHEKERDQFKGCALGVQYGMGPESLSLSISQPTCAARNLLSLHHETYPVYWKWSEAAIAHAMLRNELHTVFDWRIHLSGETNARSLANFPMQGNGAEMLRLACSLMTERGITVCCPVHDAVLVESSSEDIDRKVAAAQEAMREASEIVLSGFSLRTDVKIVKYPDRYMDKRGKKMWETVMRILQGRLCMAA